MISLNNASKVFLSQSSDTGIKQKSKASQSVADVQFKSIFNNTLSKNSRSEKVNVTRDTNDKPQSTDSSIKYNSYRELKADKATDSNNNKAVEKSQVNDKLQDIESDAKKQNDDSKEYDEAINIFAQMLGMKPEEFVKLANELGFTEEDLKDTQKLLLFTEKLSNLLELNNTQKAMLNLVATAIENQTNADTKAVLKDSSAQEEPQTSENETKFTDVKSIDLSKVATEVKNKLDQLIKNAEVNSKAVSSEISRVIEAMKAQSKSSISINRDTVNTQASTDISGNDEGVSLEQKITEGKSEKVLEVPKVQNKEAAANEEKDSTADETMVNTVINATQTVTNDAATEQNIQVFADAKIGITNAQAIAEKATTPVHLPVRTSEVINQIVEQAKVVVGQDKSEMVIQMKPDHLGKLELKVVTEQGIVAAKFIAESHQVKEIIETNMQLLKDSLQKQGITVEGISVQVGSDKQNEYQQQGSYKDNNSSAGNKHYRKSNAAAMNVGMNTIDTLPDRLAQYGNEASTINLTA